MVKRPMLQQALHLGRFPFQRLLLASILAWLALGCGSQLRERTVSDVTLLETSPSALDTDDVLAGLATAAPRKLLWVVRERDVYDANLVARDLERIERFYRAHGYYDVKVVAARVTNVGTRQVEIEVHVTPGPRVVLRSESYDPPRSTMSHDAVTEITNHITLKVGEPFQESELDKQKNSIETALRDAGYAYAKVRVVAKVDLNARAADAVTIVALGPLARFGEIRIGGLKQIPESKARAALGLKRGARYSKRELSDAQEALAALHVFSSVNVAPDLDSHPGAEEVPIIVTVQEDRLRLLTLGGGTQLDSLKWEAHLRTGWEHRNFLGGARHFSVEAQGGVDFFPTRFVDFSTLVVPTNAFFVLKSSATLEQPSIFNGRTKGSASLGLNRLPVLYSLTEPDPRNEIVLGYYEPALKLGLDRTFLGSRMELAPSYNLRARLPVWLQNRPNCDPLADGTRRTGCELQTVWVSYPKLVFSIQSKPGDIIKTDRDGRELTLAFENSVELAGMNVGGTRYFGGSLSELKIEPEVRVFVPISGKRWQDGQKAPNWAVAARFAVGFILLPDYGSSLRSGQTTTQNEISSDAALSDQQKLLMRAFFSGGPTSNRGYALRAISPHGPIGFLQPTRLNCALPANINEESCIRPLGGFTLWEASAELRFAGLYPFTLVAFADASDVSRDIGTIGFQYPHLSVGPGVRYESPVGPIRLDFGIRVPGLQAIGKDELPREHGQERPKLGQFDGAVVLAFGDAF